MLQDIALFILPALIIIWFCTKHPWQWLHLDRRPEGKTALGGILLMLAALPGNNLLAWLNQQVHLPASWAPLEQWMQQQEEAANRVLEMLLMQPGIGAFVTNLTVIAILAGISEEFFFRGALQGMMRHRQWGIWVTAFLFSALHMQFYGFVPRMLMGALFGYMLVWTGNLWIPIIMHCTNNAAITILYYIAQWRGIDTKAMDAFGTEDTLWVGILSLISVAVGIYILRRSLTMSKASSRTSKGN